MKCGNASLGHRFPSSLWSRHDGQTRSTNIRSRHVGHRHFGHRQGAREGEEKNQKCCVWDQRLFTKRGGTVEVEHAQYLVLGE